MNDKKFNQGDRVALTRGVSGWEKGDQGEVWEDKEDSVSVSVRFDREGSGGGGHNLSSYGRKCDDHHGWYVDTDDLIKISKKGGIMKKLTVFAKKHLDKDVQNFVKAGWMDEGLNVTEAGKAAVFAHYFDTNKVDMGKDAAEAVKDMEKEEDKCNRC